MPANGDGLVAELPVAHPVGRHAGIFKGLYEGPAEHGIIFDHENANTHSGSGQ